MYLSVKSTQPGCFLKAPAVQQCAGLVADPRQVSRLMFSFRGALLLRMAFSDGGVSGQAGFELDSTSELQCDVAVGSVDF